MAQQTYDHFTNGRPTLLDHHGRPIQSERGRIPDGSARPGGIALPTGFQFVAQVQGGDYTNWHDRFDEAMRHAREDAKDMLRDCSLRALLQERMLAVSSLKWHVEVPDEKDPAHIRVKDGLTRLIKGVRPNERIFPWLLEGMWYGRAGVQVEWEKINLRDDPPKPPAQKQDPGAPPGMPSPQAMQMRRPDRVWRYLRDAVRANPGDQAAKQALAGREQELTPPATPQPPAHKNIKGLSIRQAWPVNGDLIGHQEDATPYILVNAAREYELQNASIVNTTLGRALSLRGSWRERFIISKWFMEARDFFSSDEAEAIHGVGIRSHIFWLNWLKLEFLSNISEFYHRVGLGVNLWKYSKSNPQARAAVEQAAKDNTDRSNIFIPVAPGEEEVDILTRIEVPTTGADALMKVVEYLEKHIERYIVGQEGSASATSGSGHSNESSTAFQQNTKANITKQDALWCASAFTGSQTEPGVLSMMQRHTFPDVDFPAWLVFDAESAESQEKLTAIKTLVDMGVDVKADDARAAAGVSKPADGEELIKPPQPPDGPAGPGGMPGAPPDAGGGDPLAALAGGGDKPPGDAPDGVPGGPEQAAPPAEDADKGDFLDALRQMRESIDALRFDRKEKPKQKHRFSTTHFVLPPEIAEGVLAQAAEIPTDDLAEDGRADDPHVTALYGLHSSDPNTVHPVVKSTMPFKIRLGKRSIFPSSEAGGADVVKIDVHSPELHAMNAALRELPHTDTHPLYQPHITVAHVKPGMGKKYAGSHPLEGQEALLDAVTFSNHEGNETRIPLQANLPTPDSTPYARLRFAAQHAPPGGVDLEGKHYTGGEFIPNDVAARAGMGESPKKKKTGDKIGYVSESSLGGKEATWDEYDKNRPYKVNAVKGMVDAASQASELALDLLTHRAAGADAHASDMADLRGQIQTQAESVIRKRASAWLRWADDQYGEDAKTFDSARGLRNAASDLANAAAGAVQKFFDGLDAEDSSPADVNADRKSSLDKALREAGGAFDVAARDFLTEIHAKGDAERYDYLTDPPAPDLAKDLPAPDSVRDRDSVLTDDFDDKLPAELSGIRTDKGQFVLDGKPLTSAQHLAIEDYTNDGYRGLNSWLRGADDPTSKRRKLHKELQSVFKELKTAKEPVPVYRGLSLNSQQTIRLMKQLKAAQESGKPVRMAGYSSCTFDPAIAFANYGEGGGKDRKPGGSGNDVVFEIAARRGLNMGAMSADDPHERDWSESEFLMDHDTPLRVAGIREVPFKDPKTGKVGGRVVVQMVQEV